METKLLQKKAKPYKHYTNEQRQLKKFKTNIAVVAAILVVCFSMRLNKKNVIGGAESTNQHYFDMPSHQIISKFNHARIA